MGKKLIVLALAALLVGLLCFTQVWAAALIADGGDGVGINVGAIDITVSGGNLTYTYTTTENWRLAEIHLNAATTSEGLLFKGKNSSPGKFPVKVEEFSPDPYPTVATDTVPLSVFGIASDYAGTIYIAAHAALVQDADDNDIPDLDEFDVEIEESAWGAGTAFGHSNWAMFFTTTPAP